MKTITLTVEDMSCNHCVNAIEGALKEIDVSGKANLEKKTVQVDFDENKANLDQIKETIENQGYEVK